MKRVRQKREARALVLGDVPGISSSPDDDDMLEAESDAGEDSDSEYGGGTKKTGARSAKRPRLTKATGKRQAFSLSLLPQMPLDVLFEIFGRLVPKDLISVSRTNKLFRQTLMSRSSTTVWNTSLNRIGSPACPSDISGPHWAILLFETHCQACGTKGVPKVDFALRRRVCIKCKKHHLVVTTKFKSRFPDLGKSILDLLPYTNVGGWSHGSGTSSKFYWDADIEAMNMALTKFRRDVHMRVPGAKKRLDDFIEDRRANVVEVIEYAGTCLRWTAKMATQRSTDLEQAKARRIAEIRARLIGLGYLETDVNSLPLWHEQKVAELNDRGWVRLRPRLELLVQQRRDSRLLSERRALIGRRKGIVEELFNAYRKTLVPSQLPSYPRVSDICRIPEFSQHIEAENTDHITAASFSDAMDQLPGLSVQWIESKKAVLRKLLTKAQCTPIPTPPLTGAQGGPGVTGDRASLNETQDTPGVTGHAPSSTPPPTTGHSSEQVDILDLATAAFSCGSSGTACSSSKVFIGWPEAGVHHCKKYYSSQVEEPPTNLQVHRQAATTAASIVNAAGLPVSTTSAAEMDRRNLRFMCATCPARHHRKGVYGRPVFTWRSAVTHVTLGHVKPTWDILDVEQTRLIKQMELFNDAGATTRDACWSCNRCSVFVDDMKTRAVVIEHLTAVHDIAQPVEPVDLFVMDIGKLTQCLPAIHEITPPKQGYAPSMNVRCKHCVSSTQLFDEGGVRCHIKAQHKVMNPMVGTDWMTVVPGVVLN